MKEIGKERGKEGNKMRRKEDKINDNRPLGMKLTMELVTAALSSREMLCAIQ